MPKKQDLEWKAITAALDLAERLGWRRTTLGAIAEEAGVSLAELYRMFPSKTAILGAYTRRIDRQVLDGPPAAEEGEPVRDALFELLMRRFEAMRPNRAGLAAVLRGTVPADPPAALLGLARLLRAMAWTLEAAGVGVSGFCGRLRTKGLALVYLDTFRVWLDDDSEDMGPTMAALDKALARAERMVRVVRPGPRPQADEADAAAH